MSTRCNIIIRNENQIRRELFLYQHTDGHPNNMLLSLAGELKEIYEEFKDHGDVEWFLNPCTLAGALIVRSVPVMTEEMKKVMTALPTHMKSKLESSFFLSLPTINPDITRTPNCNYEYVITLKEDIEENFLGYNLEVHKLLNNRRISEVFSSQTNLLSRTSHKKTTPVPSATAFIAATKEENKND